MQRNVLAGVGRVLEIVGVHADRATYVPPQWNAALIHGAKPPLIDPARDALFLDFDGTLVPIADRPDAIAPDVGLVALLARVRIGLRGRMVIVSGRTLVDLDRHLGEAAPLAAGVHGVEIRGAGALDTDYEAQRALARARLLLAQEAGELLVEDKGYAIALHFRQQPDLGALAGQLAARIAEQSSGTLGVQPGRMVFEIKPATANKGRVVRAFLQEPLFAGSRPVFVGDDLTDEAGFDAAVAAGGYGVLVGERLSSAAAFALPDVAAVHAWLAALPGGAGA